MSFEFESEHIFLADYGQVLDYNQLRHRLQEHAKNSTPEFIPTYPAKPGANLRPRVNFHNLHVINMTMEDLTEATRIKNNIYVNLAFYFVFK